MIGKTMSHYRILEKLGEGGMGVVYKAQDMKLECLVALEFLPDHPLCDEGASSRFSYEADAISWLDHFDITAVYEIAERECSTRIERVVVRPVK